MINLGTISTEQFLAEYWQQKPLLVRGAFAAFDCPITAEELAGLACEEDVESRLILERDGKTPWEVRHGPFSEEDFTSLPPSHWTVLVQEINKHVPEFALLEDEFAFLPNWRLDDVMVSFAPQHGTVGPHVDNYDVFLIQGPGRRRWQISQQADDDLIPNLPLRIMRNFRPEQEWILEPGDMLYLPPGIAHHGVALEDCITISVGYRAPTVGNILAGFYGEAIASQDTEAFYSDKSLPRQANPGEIALSARQNIRRLIRQLATDDASIDRWFGHFITDIRPGHDIPEPEREISADTFLTSLEQAGELWRSEYCRYSYFRGSDNRLRLYAAGEEFEIPDDQADAIELICGQRRYPLAVLAAYLKQPFFLALLTQLYNLGCLYFPDDE